MKKLLLAAVALCALAGGTARADTVVQSHSNQDPSFPTHRLACTEWDRCEEIPGFKNNSGSGMSRGGGGRDLRRPSDNYYTPSLEETNTTGGLPFVKTYQRPF